MIARIALALFLALPASSVGEEALLRIVSYNIHHGRGMDDVVDAERIAAVLRDLRPDVVCLQEVDRDQPRSHFIDFTEVLAKSLDMTGVFGPNFRFSGGEYGNATLSRYPILESSNLALPTPEGIEPRGALRTVIEIDGVPVEIWNTHWGLTPEQRREQASVLLARLADDIAVIVAGDLNEQKDAPGVAMLLGPLRDSWDPSAGIGTVPVGAPRRRIDFILASPAVRVLEHRILHTETTRIASDHLPVFAVLAISRPKPEDHADQSPAADALIQADQDPERVEP